LSTGAREANSAASNLSESALVGTNGTVVAADVDVPAAADGLAATAVGVAPAEDASVASTGTEEPSGADVDTAVGTVGRGLDGGLDVPAEVHPAVTRPQHKMTSTIRLAMTTVVNHRRLDLNPT
jgi:hypothetical protein